MQVGVIDHGAGNIYSVLRALHAVGADPVILGGAVELSRYGKLIIPGVGAFGTGMKKLSQQGFIEPLKRHVAAGNPLLGICLGAQLVMEHSQEFGRHEGLGFIPGGVDLIVREERLRVPHVGWSRLIASGTWSGTLLAGITERDFVYFTHSYVCSPRDRKNVLAEFRYGSRNLTAAVLKDNVYGIQFHPELSARSGIDILRRFVTS